MAAHAYIGPSSMHRTIACPAHRQAEDAYPDSSSPYAREGTFLHELAQLCVDNKTSPEAYLGRVFEVEGEKFVVDMSVAGTVNYALKAFWDMVPEGATILTEQRVYCSEAIGHPDTFGTVDVIVFTDNGVILIDWKFGAGVRVDATHNAQLQTYALGVVETFGALGPFNTMHLAIIQPRLNHVSEWVINEDDLNVFRKQAHAAVQLALSDNPPFKAGDHCKFCKHAGNCDELKNIVVNEFEALPNPEDQAHTSDHLSRAMQHVPLVELWAKAVRAEVERRLLNGHEIPGFKLVEGRRGHRKWTDAKAVEDALKAMRVKNDQMFEFKLITPTAAEKLVKAGKLGPRQWSSLEQHITQQGGKPSVATSDDPRPPVQNKLDFDLVG